jgi:hypothetical protein
MLESSLPARRTTMEQDDLEDMGPIDYLVVEFPGSRMTGEGLPLLVDLVDRGIIRILDLVFVKKELDGSVRGLAIADLDSDGKLDLAVFEGASSGLLDQGDLDEAWCTRTAGRPRSPRRFGGAVPRWSPAAASPSRPCSPPWTPPNPSPSRQSQRKGSPMPGLLRGVARTAVIAGTATAVSNRVSRRQANRWAGQNQQAYEQQAYEQQAPASQAPAPADDMDAKLEQLRQLGELKSQGVLSEEEFFAQKQRILGS